MFTSYGVLQALILFWLGKQVLLMGPKGTVILTAANASVLIPLLLSGILKFVGIVTIKPLKL